jgi:hypothetical protein
MSGSGAIHEPITSDSITVQFRTVKVSQVQYGSLGTTRENSVTSSPDRSRDVLELRASHAN